MLHIYTMEQVRAFEEAAHANRVSEVVDTATSFRAAQSPGKDWKRYVEEMATAAEKRRGKKAKTQPVASVEQVAALRNLGSRRTR